MDHRTLSTGSWATAAVATQKASSDVLEEFGRTLGLAAPIRILQMIVSAGPEVSALLAAFQECVRQRGTCPEPLTSASELTDWWNEIQRTGKQRPRSGELTLREMSIVALMGRGHSNKEIALRLGIAPETVKAHIKNIFVKLKVERRTQAVLRAHALGLIDAGESIPVSREAL